MKSPPELWAECSDAASLARHLGAFGEIRITKLEPETAVAWEGEAARGTVTLEAAGWGTRVILTAVSTARVSDPEPEVVTVAPEPEAVTVAPEPEIVAPEPEAVAAAAEPEIVDPEPEPRVGFFARLFGRRPPAPAPEKPDGVDDAGEPELGEADDGTELVAESRDEPAPAPAPPSGEAAILAEALDSLGRAHHRPFSRG